MLSPSWSAYELVSDTACNAVRYLLTKSTTDCLWWMIMKPVGLSMRSISSNKSSALHYFFSLSENTVQAWSKS